MTTTVGELMLKRCRHCGGYMLLGKQYGYAVEVSHGECAYRAAAAVRERDPMTEAAKRAYHRMLAH